MNEGLVRKGGVLATTMRATLMGLLLCSGIHTGAHAGNSGQSRFASAGGSTTFPIDVVQGVVIVPVTIGASRPLRFVLDSGSSRTLIDRTLAVSLGLKEGDVTSVQGAGQGRIPIRKLHDVDLQIPGLDSKGYDCFTIDLAPVEKAIGVKEDGVLGYDFFVRYVVTIDFEAKRMTVALPSAFHPLAGSRAIPLEIRHKWPFVRGEIVIDGPVTTQDSFLVDLGSSDAVDHPIVKTMQDRTVSKSGVGLGSPIQGAVAKATEFSVGGYRLQGPITLACCGATDDTSRLIGTEVWRRFTVTLDYPSLRLFLEPNRAFKESFVSSP